ncbi:MAG: hypothetical protein JXR58_10240 [Bacteroidales bacterium]|nr:hypothetical protein [Bacteroidales bacterium]
MNLRTTLLALLIVFSVQLFSQNYTIEIIKNDNKFIQKNENDQIVKFKIFGVSEENLLALKNQAKNLEGVKSLEYGAIEDQTCLLEIKVMNDFNEIKFQKLVISLNIAKVRLDDVEIDAKKVSMAFRNDEEYRKELKKINQRIKDIQTKIDWVNTNEEEKALAEQNGWFEKANASLEEARKEKKDLMENNNN